MRRRGFLLAFASAALVCRAAEQDAAKAQDAQAIERRVFELVNEVRRREGLNELRWDDKLAAEARRHSSRMAVYWFFSHDDPGRGNLAKRLRENGIGWRLCAENIFNEQGYRDVAAEAVKGWLSSPPHRANVLNRSLTDTGVGMATRADGTVFVTQDFIRR